MQNRVLTLPLGGLCFVQLRNHLAASTDSLITDHGPSMVSLPRGEMRTVLPSSPRAPAPFLEDELLEIFTTVCVGVITHYGETARTKLTKLGH